MRVLDETEVDEKTAFAVLERRYRAALHTAPELFAHMRSLALRPGTEPGAHITHQHTPLRTQLVDELDEAFAQLVDWVGYWAEQLDRIAPLVRGILWSRMDGEVLGFQPDVRVDVVEIATRSLTEQLLVWHPEIVKHDAAAAFFDDIGSIVWSASEAHPREQRHDRPAYARPCPACGSFAVRAEFFGSPMLAADRRGDLMVSPLWSADERRDPATTPGRMILAAIDGVELRCSDCPWKYKPTAREVMRWLD